MKNKKRDDRQTIASVALIAFQLAIVSQLVGEAALDSARLVALYFAAVGLPILSSYVLIVNAREALAASHKFWVEETAFLLGLGASVGSVVVVFYHFSPICAVIVAVIGVAGLLLWQLTECRASNELFFRRSKTLLPPMVPSEADRLLVECAVEAALLKGLTHREWYSDQEVIDFLRQKHPETFALFSGFAEAYREWAWARVTRYHAKGSSVLDAPDADIVDLARRRDERREALLSHLNYPDNITPKG
jgi:hypothetical protein